LKKNIIVFYPWCDYSPLVLDQITKAAIVAKFFIHESYTIVTGFFNLVYVMNPGAAFGFLAKASATFRYFFFTGINYSGYYT